MKYFLPFLALLATQPQSIGQEPQRLSVLRDSYKREIDRVTKPVNKKYLDALFALRDNYTKSGDLNAATSIQKEIDIVNRPPFENWLQTIVLNLDNNFQYKFEGKDFIEYHNGKESLRSKRIIKIIPELREVQWQWPDGRRRTLIFQDTYRSGTYVIPDRANRFFTVEPRE